MKYRKLIISSCILTFIFLLSGCTTKVEKISIKDVPSMNVGDSYRIVYNVTPDNASDKKVSFKSSDEKIATIDNNGLIKALTPGSAEITVISHQDTKIQAKVTVTINQPVESIDCKSELNIALDKEQSINATALPENASDKSLVYTSSDDKVAKVDENGNITGVSKGVAVITVTSANGITAESKITVKQPVTSITLDKKSLNLTVGATSTLKASLSPKDADFNAETTFSSSDKSVATVDSNGKIKAVSAGSATVTATAKDADGKPLTASCKVQVAKKTSTNTTVNKNKKLIKVRGQLNCWSNEIEISFYPQEEPTKITIEAPNKTVNSIDDPDYFKWVKNPGSKYPLTLKCSLTTYKGNSVYEECVGTFIVTIDGYNLVYDGTYWKLIN